MTSRICRTLRRGVPELAIYSGNDDMVIPALSVGGLGVISVAANIIPADMHNMCQLYFDGKVKEAAQMQLRALDLIDKLFIEVNPIPIKNAMNMLGYEVGDLRMPLCDLEEKERSGCEKGAGRLWPCGKIGQNSINLQKIKRVYYGKVIMNGANGKMGQVITRLVSDMEDVSIVAGVDINDSIVNTYPVSGDIFEVREQADVIIDFSHPSCLENAAEICP